MKSFKIARIKKDLTQKQLSEMLGMSIATVNRLENASKPTDDIKVRDLKKICSALDLDVVEFIKKND